MRKLWKLIVLAILLVIMGIGFVIGLFYYGILLFNNPSMTKYPVRGVDVSSYQGEIDWEVLSKQEIHFAYIKATEGSNYKDRCFNANFENASKTDLRIGAYHFFSFDSSGETQAANFISTVPKKGDLLPPVVDVEFYGNKEKNPPKPDEVRKELSIMLSKLTDYYGKTPVLYLTEQIYSLYIEGHYTKYDIWIRNVFTSPKLSGGKEWTFWQYTNREKLDGYNGPEKYIDMNVFRGNPQEFNQYGNPNTNPAPENEKYTFQDKAVKTAVEEYFECLVYKHCYHKEKNKGKHKKLCQAC